MSNMTTQRLFSLDTTVLPPTFPMTTRSPGLSEEDKEKQRKFLIIVLVCFFTFLFVIFGYVVMIQFKKIRRIALNRKRELLNDEQPTLTRRTSMVGQGQKQVVIERRANSNRKNSICTGNGTKVHRSSSNQSYVDIKTTQNGTSRDRLLPPSPMSPEDSFVFSLYSPEEGGTVKYADKKYQEKFQKTYGDNCYDGDKVDEDTTEKSTTEDSEEASSTGDRKRMSFIPSEDEEAGSNDEVFSLYHGNYFHHAQTLEVS